MLAIAAAFFVSLPAAADYPERPIELVVPWSPGGGSDTLMRIVADALEPRLGQPVNVRNVPGLSGTSGMREAAGAEPDGYTAAQLHEGLLVSHKTGLTDIGWRDFAPVALMTSSPHYLAVNADSPWQSFEDFAAAARAKPDSITFAVTLGGAPHLHAAMLEDALGANFDYIGYEGAARRIEALVDGEADATLTDFAAAREAMVGGELRLLALAADERRAVTADVPTFEELSLDLDMAVMRGIVLPKDAPQEARDTIEAALRDVSRDDVFLRRIRAAGAEPHFAGHEAYERHLQEVDATIDRVLDRLN